MSVRRKYKKYNEDSRISLPRIEDMVIGTQYSFSINANYPTGSIINNCNYYRRKLIPSIHWLDINYVLYGDLSPKGKIHYHGLIQFKTKESIFHFYREINKIQDIAVEVDTIEDRQKWINYIKKTKKYRDLFEGFYKIKFSSVIV